MSAGTGKHPASHRGETRRPGRERAPIDRAPEHRAPERLPGAKPTPAPTAKPAPPPAARPAPMSKAAPTAKATPVVRPAPISESERAARDGRASERAAKRAATRAAELTSTRADTMAPGPTAKASADATRSSDDLGIVPPPRARRGLLAWRRANRRITVESRSPLVWLIEQLGRLARRLLIVGKVVLALAVLAGALAAGRLAILHVVGSPRFSLREVRVGATTHVSRDEIVERAGVAMGDRLLALDTDHIAARLTRHPWIAAARVRRELPATLVVDVTERRAAAVAVIGGLYLLDEQGHPFKRATLDEADGHVVLTGISRMEYAGLPQATEAAFREALSLLAAYQHPDSLASARHGGSGGARPGLSEVHIDPRTGFSLFLYDGGGEIRLGRGAIADKLARLDEILAALGPRGVAGLRVVHLDGAASDRVPIRMAAAAGDFTAPASKPIAPSAPSQTAPANRPASTPRR